MRYLLIREGQVIQQSDWTMDFTKHAKTGDLLYCSDCPTKWYIRRQGWRITPVTNIPNEAVEAAQLQIQLSKTQVD
jgi:hypothetical protein